MSISYSSYSVRTQPTRTELDPAAPLGRPTPDLNASNVRPAAAGLLANRMDALSLQVGRLACCGLE